MGPLPDILPLGLKTDADALTGPTSVEAPYAALFPSWAELYPFLAGGGGGVKGKPPQPWDVRRPGALFELVEVGVVRWW